MLTQMCEHCLISPVEYLTAHGKYNEQEWALLCDSCCEKVFHPYCIELERICNSPIDFWANHLSEKSWFPKSASSFKKREQYVREYWGKG